MLTAFANSLQSDLKVVVRNKSQWVHPVLFFILFTSLFCVGLGYEIPLLKQVTPAIIWMTFLLISLFTIENLFRSEKEEGVLEQLVLTPQPLWWLILAKFCSYWIATALPLLIIMPLMGLLMGLSFPAIAILLLSLFMGSFTITGLGIIGATLTVGLSRSGIFLGLLLLPLYVPVLILGMSSLDNLLQSQWPQFQIAFLGALSLLTLTVGPIACASALKAGLDE